MKNIFKSTLLLLCSICLLTACEDDNDENPVLKSPTAFVLNTPAAADQIIDLANSSNVVLTCSQPNYGFPASTQYTVEVATKSDMSDAVKLSQNFTTAKMELDASEIASTLTNLELAAGKKAEDFPMNIPVYFRANAVMVTKTGEEVKGTSIQSNVVSYNKVDLKFSLPAVHAPEGLFITGNFNGWSWDADKALKMVEVYGSRDNDNTTAKFWHMVYIDGTGIKFNTATAWDGNEKGFGNITVDPNSELGSDIQDGGGNIASKNPGWYLMVVTATVSGRDVKYTVTFNKPEVWLMGPVVGNGDWKELEQGMKFEIPTTADGEFVSPAFKGAVPGGDGDGVRIYVKVPDYDWWKTEFIVGGDFGSTITYRATGGDQARVAGNVGQKVHLNFTTETGSIK